MFGVWPLRILSKSARDFWRFIVCAILDQVRPSSNHVAIKVLSMVVVPPIGEHLSRLEEVLEQLKRRNALRTLGYRELMRHLIAGPVAGSVLSACLAHKADREASFSVYKTNQPAFLSQPFLLVFRTVWIVTVHIQSMRRVPDGYSGFPAYSRMHSATLPLQWATNLP